jgi:hypothetical protein
VEIQHFYAKNDDAEFEKEAFLHVEFDLIIKKVIFSKNLKN